MQPRRTWQVSQKNVQEKLNFWHANFSVIFRCLCKSFKNNPYKCQKPTSSFCKLKSIGDWFKTFWIAFTLEKSLAIQQWSPVRSRKKGCFPQTFRIPLGIFCARWVVTCPAVSKVHYHSFIILNSRGVTICSTALWLSPFITLTAPCQ